MLEKFQHRTNNGTSTNTVSCSLPFNRVVDKDTEIQAFLENRSHDGAVKSKRNWFSRQYNGIAICNVCKYKWAGEESGREWKKRTVIR